MKQKNTCTGREKKVDKYYIEKEKEVESKEICGYDNRNRERDIKYWN